jgi:ABC-type sulfate/molybdate transport systems ATPase subunit
VGLALDINSPLRSFAVDLKLEVAPGETVAVAGPSGAGKTTVLRAVAGLRRPATGRIVSNDEVWFDASSRVDRPPERRSVGYVPQEGALFTHLDVTGNIAFAGASHERINELLDRLGIAHLARARPNTLSGGERQRVALARALARDPSVLLLDEPLASLDAHTRRSVRVELRDLLSTFDLPVLLVTHDRDDAAALAHRVAVMVDGRIRQDAPLATLVRDPADPFVVAFCGGQVLPDGRAVYPWALEVRTDGDDGLSGTVVSLADEGGRIRVRVRLEDGSDVAADLPPSASTQLHLGRVVRVVPPSTAPRLW